MDDNDLPQCLRKLVSDDGSLLGVVHLPPHWALGLERTGVVEFCPRSERGFAYLGGPMETDVVFKRAALVRRPCAVAGAVVLRGITVQEFELQPGCFFIPSAAYFDGLLAKAPRNVG